MRAAELATYYYFDFRDVKRQDRYGLLSSFPNSLPNPNLAPMFYPSCIQAMLVEPESPLLAR
jgi:hypothetical protein